MKKLVAYYRESTEKQQIGIEAQKAIVSNYIALHDDCTIVAEYIEHESGKNDARPILQKALKDGNAFDGIIVAKVDRLTRDASFGLRLCKDYKITFCDHPEMGTLEMCIYFGMAQQEREYISQRTKQALQALKAKGVKLGNPKYNESLHNARVESLRVRQSKTRNNEANKKAYSVCKLMEGKTYVQIADFLNENGYPTAKGGIWRGNQVARLIKTMSA